MPAVTFVKSAPEVTVSTGVTAAVCQAVPEGTPKDTPCDAVVNTEGVPVLYLSTSVPSPMVSVAEVSPVKPVMDVINENAKRAPAGMLVFRLNVPVVAPPSVNCALVIVC